MKQKVNVKKTVILVVFMALLAFCGYVLFSGITIGRYDIGKIGDRMHYGLDLTGGVNVVLQAKTEDGSGVDSEKMDSTVSAIKKRVDSLGVSEATVTKQGDDRIRVSIPSIQDQQQALDLIGKTAKLEFLAPDGTVILTGDDVSDSKAVKQNNSSGVEESVVTLKFNESGTQKFADATQKYLNQVISIELDGETISAPKVNAAITNGEAIIEGMSDMDEASQLAELIRGGSLPLELEPIEVTTIGPTLGQDSLQQSIFAGAIGIAAVLIFMLLFYRGLGFIADLALLVYIMVDLIIMVEMNVTLTLPGIAGMILSIGMAVDANVIIFERIKDEAQNGGSIDKAIDAGFKRAMGTIVDSNITTLIAGFVLFFLGSGSVQGFALTLVVGIVLSMITAVVVTKHLIKLVLGTHLVNSSKFYGI
ncbi:MAG: protein translocase subunit SecD [Eubacterium aggregans]|uniref:Protein translocase subunit SecD n=1 Tax=Eubacterium aggregans TaxID=81409 RepID=A0A1H4A6L6_9FIRM|nr:protein translocase subunit SecD [Eubacterium aggregans]MDD4690938.1 protein translocase subunit SecD [Eubacterium aggregans]MEA5074299.1 protein translocase subunit SecD [Eubacterium aggregans]SEA31094.1 preprotein translocase subunit SecD [Eubacterium aggregans]